MPFAFASRLPSVVAALAAAFVLFGAPSGAEAQGPMWLPGPWSACSSPCGGGSQTREYQCIDTDRGNVLPDSSCSGSKPPPEDQPCNTAACTYSWSAASWGACSVPCGGGTRSRAVSCVRDADGMTVADGNCSGPPPPDTEACNTAPCPMYMWQLSAWSACSAACDGGTRTRTVECQDDGGATVADSFCTEPRPADMEACNTDPCYAWDAGAWSACSAACGDGTQTRSVVCRDGSGAMVAESFCDAGSKPSEMEACNDGACTYSWRIGVFGACSEPCGGGTQTRPIECIADLDGATVSDSLCDAGTRPPASQACNDAPCTYVWEAGPYDECSATCGGGTRTRTVGCVREDDGAMADEALCDAATRPEATEACNAEPCPEVDMGVPADAGPEDAGAAPTDGAVVGEDMSVVAEPDASTGGADAGAADGGGAGGDVSGGAGCECRASGTNAAGGLWLALALGALARRSRRRR